jgi:DNA-binding NarL/FixJ family response regulator
LPARSRMENGPHGTKPERPGSSSPMIRIAVLDDHPAVLGGLQRLVERAPDLRPVAFVETEAALWHALVEHPADIVIVDYDLARGDGLAVCQRLKERRPGLRVLVYSAYAGSGLAVAARAAGVDGLVGKSEPVANLLSSVRCVAQGGRLLPEIEPHARHAAMTRLEEDDLAVGAMLLVDISHEVIAETLDVGEDEVAWRARRIVARMRPSGAPFSDRVAADGEAR